MLFRSRRRPELISGELRLSPLLPHAALDAGEPQLPARALLCSIGRRRSNPEPFRRVCCRRRLNAGGLAPVDQGFDLPWVIDMWGQPLLIS